MESFLRIIAKRLRGVDEIPGQEKEERDMEGINDLMKKWGKACKVVVPQNHQQNANAFCNVKILDSFRHHDVSSVRILPYEY